MVELWNNIRNFSKGWKTVLFNVLSIIIPLTEASGLTEYMTNTQMVYYIIAVIAGNTFLRLMTTTPVGKKE